MPFYMFNYYPCITKYDVPYFCQQILKKNDDLENPEFPALLGVLVTGFGSIKFLIS